MAVQDIMIRGEWLVPLKRATDIPSKPPLFHWSAALTAEATGKLNEAVIRFPSALYATLGVLVAAHRPCGELLVIPLVWCAISGATLWTMQSPDALVMPVVAALTLVLAVWKR